MATDRSSFSVTAEGVVLDGRSHWHASFILSCAGPMSVGVLIRASESQCSDMSESDAFSYISSLVAPSGFVQSGPDGSMTFGLPNEIHVVVSRSVLCREFSRLLLSRDVMLS